MSQKKKPSNPAKINLSTIKSFFQGYARKFTEGFGLLAEYKKEQVVWRTEKSKECMENGVCLFCGCDMPAKLYCDDECLDPDRKCYPEMMDEKTWEEFKKTNNIVVKLED